MRVTGTGAAVSLGESERTEMRGPREGGALAFARQTERTAVCLQHHLGKKKLADMHVDALERTHRIFDLKHLPHGKRVIEIHTYKRDKYCTRDVTCEP